MRRRNNIDPKYVSLGILDTWSYHAPNYQKYANGRENMFPLEINVLFFDVSVKWINNSRHKLLYTYKWNSYGTEFFGCLIQNDFIK